ncbi:MAG: DUF167 domain-containing protein [Candidatus Moranbacteria bacterium]|nr:DUF167 domain-containing protein [Candidatus Moranbacteria bacterium]
MKIFVKVKTGDSESQLEKIEEGRYRARVKAAPEKGKANKELVKLLAESFGVVKSAIKIISGHTSSNKIIEVGRGIFT